MAPLDRKEVEDMIARAITQAKKEADKALNAEVRKMSEKMKQMEDSIKGLTEEKDAWKKKFEELQEGINHLRISKEEGEISSFEDIEVEIKNKWKADIKEEIQTEMEAKQSGWVEVVKKNIKKEVCEEVHMGEHLRVQLTLEEERLRHLRKHNVRITGLKEGPSAEEDAPQQLYQSAGFQCVAILNTGLAVASISLSNNYEHVAVGHIDGTVSVLDVACSTLMVQRKGVFLNEQKHVRCLTFGTGVKVSAPSDSTTGTASFLRVLYAAEDSAFAALLYGNGDISSCGPWHVDDSRILYMYCQEIFNVQKAEGRIGPSADQSSENLLDKGRDPEEADLCSHCLLVCTQVSACLYHCVVSNKVATLSSLKTARFQMPCSSASTFFCQSANACRLVLLNNAATLEVRSLPGLDVVQQFSMARIYNLDPKVSENPTLVCGDQGLMALVDVKREIIMFSVLSGDENLRTGDQLVSFFDKEVAAAGEAALKAGSLPSRRKSQLQGLIGGVLKDLKVGGVLKEIKGGLLKSPKSGKELSMEVQAHDYLSKVFILPLSTNNSGSPQLVRASQAEVPDSAPELDIVLDADDIEIEDEEAIKLEASEKAAKSKGKEKVSDPADDRRKLFDGDDDHNKPVRRSPDEIRAKYGHKPLGDVSGAAGLARDKLLERQEKLQALGKRTEEMQEGAQNFSSMAAELAKTMEGRKWWQL
ncbi:hypothetical protein L7F22_035408 [Adiantum nelumboides]|nr:hypothetical protein [Adiantum nelumboides]